MNKLRILIGALAFSLTLLVMPACSTVNKAALKTYQVAYPTGNIALHVWADYVSQQKAAGTPVPLDQELQAKKAWNQFEDARELVAKAGVAYSTAKAAQTSDMSSFEAEISAATSAMAAAQADFINLLRSFGVKL